MGMTFEGSDDLDTAEKNFETAWETFNQIGASGYAMDALSGLARCALETGKLDQARKNSIEICTYLEENGSQGMEFPTLSYLTCAKVFEGTGDEERRRDSIEKGYQQLIERAEKISDPVWKRTYLKEVSENNSIQEKMKEGRRRIDHD
jgi:ATP/maltotriose-dependent transcriptional regulator MalT